MSRPFAFSRALVCSLAGLAACGDDARAIMSAAVDGGALDAMSAPDAEPGAREDAELADGAQVDADAPFTHVCGLVTDKVDLLFVIDNSGSMREEQALLTAELPRMVYALGTGDVDGDGVADFRPADLHIGVVSTDMGADLGYRSAGSGCSLVGDDGMLLSGCGGGTGTFTEYAPTRERDGGVHDAGTPTDASLDGDAASDGAVLTNDPELTRALGCLVSLGTSGCGFEEPLEAALKALTPSTSDIVFGRATLGHGDGENAGFLRPDSVLAVVVLSDEEDCSHDGSPELTWMSGGAYAGTPLNTRCEEHAELLHPIARYVDGLTAVRDNPNAFVFAVIAGVPPDLVASGASIDEMLADERMTYRRDPNNDGLLAPACGERLPDGGIPDGGSGIANPGRRLLGVAREFGERAVVTSICEDAFTRPIEAIFRRISGVLECPDDPVL